MGNLQGPAAPGNLQARLTQTPPPAAPAPGPLKLVLWALTRAGFPQPTLPLRVISKYGEPDRVYLQGYLDPVTI